MSQQGGTTTLGGFMRYPRAQVRTALASAKEAGKATAGLSVDLRETELTLEKWGFLPLPGDTTINERVADWYRAQGLAAPVEDGAPRVKQSKPQSPVIMSAQGNDAALIAAEAALAAAQAALAYARSIIPPAA